VSAEPRSSSSGNAESGRSSKWARVVFAVLFAAASATAWWIIFNYHASDGVRIALIFLVLAAAGVFLYKAGAGNTVLVSAAATLLVLSMGVTKVQENQLIPAGEVLAKKWTPCPHSKNPMAGRAPAGPRADPEPTALDLRNKYGKAHIDSVIAPDGTAHVRSQELVCISTLRVPIPNQTLWLVLRIEPTLVPPQKPYKLFFAEAQLGNPRIGQYSVRVIRSCSSSPPGSVHVLMVVSANPLQNRKLWANYNHNHTGNCLKGTYYDSHRRKLIGTIVSNQLAVTDG